jgi:uncharacterized protein (DUF1800 family)
MSLAGIVRRSNAVAVVFAGLAACSSSRHVDVGGPAGGSLSDAEKVAHVLSRLTFGTRPGETERVRKMGVDRWIEHQLHPESISDTALTVALRPLPEWNQPPTAVAMMPPLSREIISTPVAQLMKDSAARVVLNQARINLIALGTQNDRFFAGKIIHAQLGERQLLEVVSDFWENHFSVYSGKVPSPGALIPWDRDVLRPHAMGRFRDLLGAVAHSPAMLYYLDNHLSTRRGLNENYARELMELHTLGVDGGYTQKDVQEVARALTGWTIRRSPDSTVFAFRPELHDTGAKVVLGHSLASGRGIEDGEEVLDILARHPSTAHFIAFKLARRLVSDDPPPALVNRAAATYLRTDGDITQVVRTIVESPEFFSPAAYRAKVKTPFELVVSMRRALDAPADTTPATARLIAQLGQATFGWSTPEGFPDHGDAWMNSGTIYKRVKLAGDVAEGRVPSLGVNRWRDWPILSAQQLDAQVDAVVRDVFGGTVDPVTRDALFAAGASAAPSGSAGDSGQRLRALLTIALGSPDFQRR